MGRNLPAALLSRTEKRVWFARSCNFILVPAHLNAKIRNYDRLESENVPGCEGIRGQEN